jgi:hypothetical protein
MCLTRLSVHHHGLTTSGTPFTINPVEAVATPASMVRPQPAVARCDPAALRTASEGYG